MGCSKPDAPSPAVTTGTASAAVSASSVSPAAEPAELAVVARLPRGSRLFALGDSVFVRAGRLLYRADAAGLHQDVGLMNGLGANFSAGASREAAELMGFWPDGAWLVGHSEIGDESAPTLSLTTYRWVKERWRAVSLFEPGEHLLGISSFRKGTALALLGSERGVRLAIVNDRGFLDFAPSPTEWAKSLATASDAGAGDAGVDAASEPSDAASAPPDTASDAGDEHCRTQLRGAPLSARAVDPSGGSPLTAPRAVLGFESGHAFIAGTSCEDGDARVLVERYDPKTRRTQIQAIDKPRDAAARPELVLAGRSADDVWLLARRGSLLQHFDGKRFEADPLSQAERFTDISVSREGKSWLATADAVHERRGSEWRRMNLPKYENAELVPLELAAVGGDVVWVLARSGSHEVLLAKGVRSGAELLLPDEAAALKARGDVLRYPASPVCEAPFVLVASRVKPKDERIEAAARVVSETPGAELVTEASSKWTYLGASVPKLDDALKLVERLKTVPNTEPALYCHAPKNAKRVTPP